jgi:hypothetical protein
MRFIVCARATEDGAVSLVDSRSFPNRREAVEAIIACKAIDDLLRSDVFLIDLEAATPVALIPVTGSGIPVVRVEGEEPEEDSEPIDQAGLWEDEESQPASSSGAGADEGAGEPEAEVARFDVLELDIESWTCEDCIYVLTCEKSGTLRPAECGSFQWRA